MVREVWHRTEFVWTGGWGYWELSSLWEFDLYQRIKFHTSGLVLFVSYLVGCYKWMNIYKISRERNSTRDVLLLSHWLPKCRLRSKWNNQWHILFIPTWGNDKCLAKETPDLVCHTVLTDNTASDMGLIGTQEIIVLLVV